MSKGGFIKDTIKNLSHTKPVKISYPTEMILKRLKDRKNSPTDDELFYYASSINNYEELGYIAHLISCKRSYHKKKYNADIYRDTATLCSLKREMLRDDNQLCELLSKHLEWFAPNLKPTTLTFGEKCRYNEEHEAVW